MKLLKVLHVCSLTLLIVIMAALMLSKGTAVAATSSTINFQARLQTASGAIVQDGNYNVEFKIYNASSSSGSSQGSCTGDSNCLWVETRTGANVVRVVDGYLTVNLGSVNAFAATMPWDQQLWLTMNIGGTGTPSWDGEMNPRIQLTAVPYAFKAAAAFQIQNASYTTLLTSSGNQISLPSANSSTNALTFAGDSTADLYRSGSGILKTDGYLNAANGLQTNNTTRIDSGGNVVNVGNISASGNITLTAGGVNAMGYSTTNTTNLYSGQWTLLGTCTITAQYQDCHSQIEAVNVGDGAQSNFHANVDFRAKQQNAMGGQPYVEVEASNLRSLTANQFVAVTTQNDASATVVGLYMQVNQSYQVIAFNPVINTSGSGSSHQVQWLSNQGYSASLPAGVGSPSQFTATYSNAIQGTLSLQPAADAANVLQVENLAGSNILSVDTSAGNGNLVTTSDMENSSSTTANWVSKGTSTVSQTTSQYYQGTHSVQAVITAASSGLQTSSFTTSILPSTQYQLNFYERCSSSISTFTYGRQDVSGTDINGSTTAGCSSGGWQYISWHFTTGATITSPNIYFTMGSTTSGTLYIDAVSLIQTTTSSYQPYYNGALQVNGVINTPVTIMPPSNSTTAFEVINAAGTGGNFTVDTLNARVNINSNGGYGSSFSVGGTDIFRNTSNSTTGFQVQNSSAIPIFDVDSSSNLSGNKVTNYGFEVNTTGWVNVGGGTTTRQTTITNAYAGVASGQVVTTATANSGTRTNTFTATVGAGTYTFSFYAKVNSGTFSTLAAGYNTGSDTVCTLNNNTVLTTGFQRYWCTFTTAANLSSLWIEQTDATARTFYIDGVQLVSGTSPNPYTANGAIQLRGAVATPTDFQNYTDSTTAFQIQNASGQSNLFVADTLNSLVGIGAAPATNGATLQVNGSISATSSIGFTNAGNANQAITLNEVVTSSVNAGDVVVIDTGNPGQVTDATTANSTQVFGIATTTNASGNVAQPIAVSGIYQVNVTGTVSVGNYLVTTTTAGVATASLAPSGGVIGQALSANSGGKAWVLINPGSAGSNSLGTNGTTSLYESNAQTDTTRAAALQTGGQGDGRDPIDSSTGAWEGTTNILTNGGLEGGIGGGYSGWQANGSGATVAQSSSYAKFGSYSLKVTTDGTSAFRGSLYLQNSGISAGNTYTVSVWVFSPSDTTPMQLNVYRKTAVGGSVVGQTTTNFNLTSQWQRVSLTFTAESGATDAEIEVRTNSTQPANTFYVDGMQVEQKAYATPYVETNGATATRNASRIQAPSSLISSGQGWFAARIRAGVPATVGTNLAIAGWKDSTNTNGVSLYFDYATKTWKMRTLSGGVSTDATSAVQSFNAGDYLTVVGYWQGSKIGVSVNGGAFVTTSLTLPTFTTLSSFFELGTQGTAASQLDGDIMWAAAGTGTLVDADAAALNAYGNSDPSLSGLSTLNAGASTPTMAWSAEDVYINQGGSGSGLQGGSGSYIQNTTSLQTGNINLQSGNTGVPAAIFRGATGQTANILEVQDSTANKLLTVDTSGNLTVAGNIGFSNSGNANQALTINEPVTGSVTAGDVVVIDTSNAGYVKDSSSANSTQVVGIATKTQTGGTEPIVISGIYQVNVGSNAPSIGNYLVTDGNTGEANGTTSPSGGVIGQAMSTASSNKVWALIKPASGTGGGGSSSSYGLMESDFINTGATVPSNVISPAVATIGNTVYMFGGYTGVSALNTIYSAPVSNPTSWTNTGATLPSTIYSSSFAIIGSNMYLFGGFVGGTGSSAIFTASVSNPTVWTNTGATLPGALSNSSLAVIGNYIYLFGGYSPVTNVIYRAPVSNPTSWTNTGSTLPGNLENSSIAVIGSYVYLFGGDNGSGATNVIYRAPVSNPTSWISMGGTLPGNLSGSQLEIIGNYIYLFGGFNAGGGNAVNVIYRAPIGNPVNGWANTGSTLPGNLDYSASAIVGNAVYLFGGQTGASTFTNVIYSAPIYNGSPDISSNPSWKIDSNAGSGGSGTSSQTASSNFQLAYGEYANTVSTSNNSEANSVTLASSGSYTYDGNTSVDVEFFAPLTYNSSAGSNNVFELFEDSTDLGRLSLINSTTASDYVPVYGSRIMTPTAGAHTFTAKLWVGGGTGYVLAGPGGSAGVYEPMYIRVTRANPQLQGGSGIANGTTTQTANFNVQSSSASSVTAVIQGATSQSADILEVKDASNTNLLAVDASGNLTVKGTIGFANQGNANQGITLNMKVTSAVNANDVVVIDTANAGQVTDSTSANSTKVFGIATQTKSAGQYQPIVISGVYQVNVGSNTPSIGDYLVTDSNTGEAQNSSSPTGGIVGQALSTASSNKVWALIKPASGAGGGGGGGLTKLYDVTLGASTANFDVTNLPSGYDSLEGELIANNDTASAQTALIRLNNVSTNYYYQYAYDAFTTHTANDSSNGTATAGWLGVLPRANGNLVDVKFTISTPGGRGTHIESQFGAMDNNADGAIYTGTASTTAANVTSSVNRVTILPSSGNFLTGSRFILYGVGGSSSGGGIGGQGNTQLSYNEYTSPVAVTGTSMATAATVVTSNSVYDDGYTPLEVSFYSPYIQTGTNGDVEFGLYIDGSPIAELTEFHEEAGSNNVYSPIYASRILSNLSAGWHTFKVVAYSINSVAGYVEAGNGTSGNWVPGYIRITLANPSLQGGSGSYIQNGTSLQGNANFNIMSASATSVTATIHGASGQSADVLDVQNSSNVNLLSVDPNGNTFVAGNLNVGGTIGFSNIGNANQGISLNMVVTSAVSANDVVVIDTNNPGQVTTTTLANSTKVFGVATQTQSAGVSQPIITSGIYQVNVDTAAVNVGDYLVTSGIAGRATDSTSPSGGVIGQALSAKSAGSNGTVWARINPGNGAGGSGSGGAGYGLMESDFTNTGATLPGPVSSGVTVTVGNTIYMIGGSNTTTNINKIYSAPVSNPTSWTDTGATIPAAIGGMTDAIVGSNLYLFGGINTSGQPVNTIYYAPLSNIASTAAWTTVSNPFPNSIAQQQLAIVGSTIYMMGGVVGAGATLSQAIWSAPVSNPLSWSNTAGTIPVALRFSSPAVIGNYLYLFGGASSSVVNNIYRAPVSNPVTGWTTTSGVLPHALETDGDLAIVGNYVYVFGGYDGTTSSYTNVIYKAPITNPVGGWSTAGTSTIPASLAGVGVYIAGNALYLAGGGNSTPAFNTLYSAPIINGSPDVSSNPSWITDSNYSSGGGSGTSSQTSTLNVPSVHAYATATTSVATSTWTTIPLGAETFDTNNMHSTSSNTSRITFNTAGTYTLTASVDFSESGSGAGLGRRMYQLIKNGSTAITFGVAKASGYGDTTPTLAVTAQFSAGDYVELQAFQDSGYTMTVASGDPSTSVSAVQEDFGIATVGIQNGTTVQTGNFNIQSSSASNPTAVIQGATSQSADILDIKNGSGTVLVGVTATGKVNIGTSGTGFGQLEVNSTMRISAGGSSHIDIRGGSDGSSSSSIYLYNPSGTLATVIGDGTYNSYIGGKLGINENPSLFNLQAAGAVAAEQNSNTYVTLGQDPAGSSSPTTYGGMYFDGSQNLRMEALSGGVAWRNIILQGQGSGNVGIGATTTPSYKLHVFGTFGVSSSIDQGMTAASNATFNWSGGLIKTGGGVSVSNGTAIYGVALSNAPGDAATVSGGGVLYAISGALRYKGSSGTITTIANADYAESMPVLSGVQPEDIVSLSDQPNTGPDKNFAPYMLQKTQGGYDSEIIGVVSSPAGANSKGGEQPIALNGRVPVHVTDENGPIAPGDYLTSSSTPGYAMKATHGGMIIGRALEYFGGSDTTNPATGTVTVGNSTHNKGSVLVFVNTTYYSPGVKLQGSNADVASLTATSLTVNGDASVAGNITVGGHIIGNADTSGTITVTNGQSSATHTFDAQYSSTPKVVVTPDDDTGNLHWWVTKSNSNFTVHLSSSAPSSLNFDYMIQQSGP